MEAGSYLLIERGMPVRGTDADLGSVEQVIADVSADVFRGLIVSAGFLPPRQSFVAGEHVVSVTDGVVHVNLSRDDAERLPGPQAANPALT